MAKMMPPGGGEPKVRVVEIDVEVAAEGDIEALSITDFATREDEADKSSIPAPVRTVTEDDIPDPGRAWFRVLGDGKLKRWKQTPAE